eukprot:14654613-Alexandrium_andersonii.AAC.1
MLRTYYFFAHAAALAPRIFHQVHRLHLMLTPCRRAYRCMLRCTQRRAPEALAGLGFCASQ